MQRLKPSLSSLLHTQQPVSSIVLQYAEEQLASGARPPLAWEDPFDFWTFLVKRVSMGRLHPPIWSWHHALSNPPEVFFFAA